MNFKEFQHIISPVKNTLFRLAKSVVGNSAEAEDIVQEVYIKAWKNRSQLSEIRNVEAWCMRITKNLSIDKLRQQKSTVEMTDHHTVQMVEMDNPHQKTEQKDAFKYIQQLMQQLPTAQRMVIHLRDVEGCRYQEIADDLDMPLTQVKVNLHRGRKQLQKLLLKSEIPLDHIKISRK